MPCWMLKKVVRVMPERRMSSCRIQPRSDMRRRMIAQDSEPDSEQDSEQDSARDSEQASGRMSPPAAVSAGGAFRRSRARPRFLPLSSLMGGLGF